MRRLACRPAATVGSGGHRRPAPGRGGATGNSSLAQSRNLGMLSLWEEGRNASACTGALYKCTDIAQTP